MNESDTYAGGTAAYFDGGAWVTQPFDLFMNLYEYADPNPGADFYESLLQRNLIGGFNGFEAARRAGCRRLVFASSINAVLGYGDASQPTTWEAPAFPQNVYGATKVWGEALARVYSDPHGLSCLCVRLTSPSFDQAGDWDPEQPMARISPRDTAQVFGRCVDALNVSITIREGSTEGERTGPPGLFGRSLWILSECYGNGL